MSEVWKAVVGYEGRYEVSSLGRVRSARGLFRCSSVRRGYPSVLLRGAGMKPRMRTVHSLVAEAFIGPRLDGMVINHKSGVKSDNRAENIEYCTQSENAKHAHATGLQLSHGEHHSRSKLTDEKVMEIRSLRRYGMSQTAIARRYGVDPSAISRVCSGKRWSHLDQLGGVEAKNLVAAG